MKKITLLILFLTTCLGYSQANSYSFSQTMGAYSEIFGGTILGNEFSNDQSFIDPEALLGVTGTSLSGVGLPIGFEFTFNGVVYDRFGVNNNGWISLGKSTLTPSVDMVANTDKPLSYVSSTFTTNDLFVKIAPLGKDLAAQTGSSLRYETIGTAPNRTLVVQFKNYKKYNSEVSLTDDSFNFQVRLNETTNTINFVYGLFTSSPTVNQSFQVGIRAEPASAATNFASRTSSTGWSSTIQSILSTDGITMIDTMVPSNGLTYTWTPPTCVGPSGLNITSITSSSATLTWLAGASAPIGFEYVLSTSATFPTLSGISNANTTVNVSDLMQNTTYYVFLRANCGTEFSNWLLSGTFKTKCGSKTSYFENFDTYSAGSSEPLPDCWSKITVGNGNAYLAASSAAPNSAPNRLFMTASGSVNPPTKSYVIMPAVENIQTGTYRLKFKAYASSANKTLNVGYFTDLENINSFVLLQAINMPGSALSTTQEFTVIPTGVPAGVTNLVFENLGATTGAASFYIDDVVWEAIPNCGEVTAIGYSSISNSQINLFWTPGSGQTNWQYVYGGISQVDPTTLTPVDVMTTSNALISGLSANTAYKIWVRSNCGSGNFGAWIGPLTVGTLCEEVTDFTENFDSSLTGATNPMPTCWDRLGNASTYVNTGGTYPGSAPNRLYLSAIGTGSAPTVSIALMPAVSNLQAGTHRLKFKAYATSVDRSVEIGYLEIASDPSSFVNLATYPLPSTAASSAIEFSYIPNVALVPASVRRLVFRNSAPAGITTIYIDDVIWQPIPPCADINTISSGLILSTSANFSWNEGGAEENWQYVYAETNVTDPTTLAPVDVSVIPTAALSNLLPNTSYNVWIRSNCGSGAYGLWSAPWVITTECAPVTEYSENFDTSATGSNSVMPNCWSKNGTTGSVYVNTGGAAPGSVPNRLYMTANANTSTVAIAIMPPVSNLQAETHRLRFKAYATATGKSLQVGYFTNPLDDNSFNLLQSIAMPSSTASTALEFTILPIDVPEGVLSLVFKNIGANSTTASIYIDDVVWEAIPTCTDIINIVTEDVGSNSAAISWLAGASESAWQYVYAPSTVTDPVGLSPVSVANNPLIQINNLDSNSTYNFWIRSDCGAGLYGTWSEIQTFTTDCTGVTEFSENFDSYATGATSVMADCWRKLGNGVAYVTSGGGLPGSAPNRLYMVGSGPSEIPSISYVALPAVSNLQAETHRLKFKAYATIEGRKLEVGYFNWGSNIGTFVVLENFILPGTTNTVAQEFTLTPNGLPVDVTTLVFRNPGVTSGAATQLYIDDVVWELIPAVVADNDECGTATILAPGATFATGSIVSSNVNATASEILNTNLITPTCGTYSGGDVWYSIVVPDSGSITIETNSDSVGVTDTVVEVYSGTCGNLVSVECDDDDSGDGLFSKIALTGRTPGEVLYARVFTNNNTQSGTFKIAAYDASLSNVGFDLNTLQVYPNPVKNILNLKSIEIISSVKVFNLLGQEVISKNINATQSQIDMASLASGTYLIKVMVEEKVLTIKVSKE